MSLCFPVTSLLAPVIIVQPNYCPAELETSRIRNECSVERFAGYHVDQDSFIRAARGGDPLDIFTDGGVLDALP